MYQLVLLGSVCRMFLFFSGLSLRFLKATSFPSPTERKVILGVDRSLNFTTVEFGSVVVVFRISLSLAEALFALQSERRLLLPYH